MGNWFNKDILREKLSTKEKINLYEDVRDLREDLEFFNLYIKRNKKSKFNFSISFNKGLNTSFLTYLYTKSYGYHLDALESLYTEYLVAVHFFKTLYGEEDEVVYSDDDLRDIYNHFLSLHEIKLEDYVTDFIGCSRGCMDVSSKIIEMMKNKEE